MAKNLGVASEGWQLYAHPLFLSQVENLISKVEAARAKHPTSYQNKRETKHLAAINHLIWEAIPQNPADAKYRQGNALGKEHKHWYRAKFFQQYRLFFRYHAASKVIIYGWVNDDKTKRAYGSKTDAYYVFEKMLNRGNPPTDWNKLLEVCRSQTSRLEDIAADRT